MASIFTYEPDPPRVASPWLHAEPDPESQGLDPNAQSEAQASTPKSATGNGSGTPTSTLRLQAEPQEGPVEYKLHLLLRPRRKFKSTSTATLISGSKHSSYGSGNTTRSFLESSIEPISSADPKSNLGASTQQTRQHRLEQLTTQLLWRLQQSSPHHTSSATNIILPSLPEALPELQAPSKPAKLLHGLEESQGALYEIGVSDDGTLVGLAEDEMQESLNNLRAMAACLGCTVEVLRRETVGHCEWLEEDPHNGQERRLRKLGKLFVVETWVKPCLAAKSPLNSVSEPSGPTSAAAAASLRYPPDQPLSAQRPEQLRITLTGPTMSGKSTLLGTLTTSTLDNGKGKSRLSMLKHRHEITSGVTSSVTQELLGYDDAGDREVEVVNYATENVASWIDIHAAVGAGRLVFISDSAGHPRYRRTTIRSLVGWAPHYTVLCIPANDTEDPNARSGSPAVQGLQNVSGSSVPDMDLSTAQLDLCLRLRTPLVVVVTKLDLASKPGLRGTLTKILDALKAVGRKPAILPHSLGETTEASLHLIQNTEIESAYNAAIPLLNDAYETVPIALTSAVRGTGISNLHALLHELPIPPQLHKPSNRTGVLFHIEDVYSKPAEVEGVIVSGRLRFGRLSIGDTGVIGPFSIHEVEDSEDSDERPSRKAFSQMPTSRSFPGAIRHGHLTSPLAHLPNHEWRRFKVNSVRNLRLPVHGLEADEVGTVAIVPEQMSPDQRGTDAAAMFASIRKGMILADVQPQATRTFVAMFKREDLESLAVGNHVVVYIASARASARVISARAPDSPVATRSASLDAGTSEQDDQRPFQFDDDLTETNEKVAGSITAHSLLVTFNFDNTKEYVLVGDQVLVMPGGGPGLYGGNERGEKGIAGLDGFVGQITETYA